MSARPDFLLAPKVILHKRITNEMKKLNMEGVKFIPTELAILNHDILDEAQFYRDRDNIINDYVCVDVKNNYSALDREKSFEEWDGGIKLISLDQKVLEKKPLNKRLAFHLREAGIYTLFHQSVIDVIISLNPTGVNIYDIEGGVKLPFSYLSPQKKNLAGGIK
jgi:hypothetical protein